MAGAWESQQPARGRIVLLHGVMSSAATWWHTGPALAARGWHVRALDLAGHGTSPPLGQPVSLDLLVQGVVERVTEPFDVVAQPIA